MQDDIKPPVNRQNVQPVSSEMPQASAGLGVIEPSYQLTPPKRSKKKIFLIVLLVLLLLGGGAAAYWYWFMREEPVVQAPQQHQATEQPITVASGRFYISKTHEEITVYDPVSQKSSSVKFPLGARSVFPRDIHGNQAVAFSADGKKLLVANYTAEPGEGEGGKIIKRQLSIFENGKETELTPLNSDQQVTPADLLMTPDGKTVYMLLGSEQKDDPLQLHSIDVATKKITMLSENVVGMHEDRTPFMLDADGVLSFYTQVNKVVTHHMVKDGKYSTAKVGTVTCTCSFEYPQAVSPDGKNIILEEIKDGEKGDFTYHLLTTADGKTSQLAKPPKTTEQYLNWLWMPDSKQVAFDLAGFGAGEPVFQPRVEILDVATKQSSKVVSYDDSKENSVHILAWSPDGRLLALVDNEQVKFYDMTNKKLVETGISLKSVDSETQYGWLK